MVPLQLVVASALIWTGEPNAEILDFTAVWCGPCQQVSKVVSKLQRDGVPIRKVDIDHEPSLKSQYNITSIPAFILLVDGKEVAREVNFTQSRPAEAGLRRLCAMLQQSTAEATGAPQKGEGRQSARVAANTGNLGDEAPFPPKTGTAQAATAKAEAPKKAPAKPNVFSRLFQGKQDAAPAAPAEVRAQDDDPLPTTHENQPATPLSATVRLRVKDNRGDNVGTGTIIDSRTGQTLILTCGHIFREWSKGSRLYVDVFNGEQVTSFVGKLEKYELDDRKGIDIGLVSFACDQPLPACRVASSGAGILAGAPVCSVGCGGGDLPSVQQQKITTVNRYKTNDIECSAIPEQGRSGGGLFNREGQVIGICMCADPKYREGLYAGLKAIHMFLDRQRLTHLYRDDSAAGEEPQLAAQAESKEDDAHADRIAEAAEPTRERPRRKSKDVPMIAEADASHEPPRNPAVSQEDIEGSEVVIYIRGNGKHGSPSKIVRLHRATRGFWEDLVSEIDPRESLQETTLKRTTRDSAQRSERRQVRRPASIDAADKIDRRATADAEFDDPDRYRRQRTVRRDEPTHTVR